MDKNKLQKLRSLPIEGVAERLGLSVSRHKSLCPFHDDHHASMSYHVRKNTCRCFVCMDESIGTIDLAMRHLRMNFKETCNWLANENNIMLDEYKPTTQKQVKEAVFDASKYERFFLRPWLSTEARRFLFDERRLHPKVIEWCRVSSWCDREGVNWLQTPYYNIEGQLIGIQNRLLASAIGGAREGLPRFRFPYGSHCNIYNLPVIKRLKDGDELWITEGCSDCWAMLSSGHKAIAIPSATLLSPKDKQLLADLSTSLSLDFHMFPDNDLPSERLFMQLKEILPNLVHHHLPLGCKDYSEYYIRTKTIVTSQKHSV